MIARPANPLTWVVPFLWLFGFTVLGQEPQSSAKPETPSVKTPEIITNMTLESFQQFVQGMGFDCTRDKDEKGTLNNYFKFKAEGYEVVASVPVPSSYLYLNNAFSAQLPPELINQWNGTNNFNRVYSKPETKAVYLDTEIVIFGGVTRANIEAQIKEFRDSVAEWARFVIDHQKLAETADKKPVNK